VPPAVDSLACRRQLAEESQGAADLPPVRLHDLRHGATADQEAGTSCRHARGGACGVPEVGLHH
jgi:integrase